MDNIAALHILIQKEMNVIKCIPVYDFFRRNVSKIIFGKMLKKDLKLFIYIYIVI